LLVYNNTCSGYHNRHCNIVGITYTVSSTRSKQAASATYETNKEPGYYPQCYSVCKNYAAFI